MKICLIGYPISHSLSPQLCRQAHPFWSYDLIETSDFGYAYSIFLKDYDAANITSPYKEKALSMVDNVTNDALQAGATNLLIKKYGIVYAFNTDIDGAAGCIDAITSKGKVLVIGCSGAGKAAAIASLNKGYETSIINRTFEKSYSFAQRLGEKNIKVYPFEKLEEAITANNIIIYCIPVLVNEMKKMDLSSKAIIEANYRDPSLNFVQCRKYIDGKEWLQAQAEACWDTISSFC